MQTLDQELSGVKASLEAELATRNQAECALRAAQADCSELRQEREQNQLTHQVHLVEPWGLFPALMDHKFQSHHLCPCWQDIQT